MEVQFGGGGIDAKCQRESSRGRSPRKVRDIRAKVLFLSLSCVPRCRDGGISDHLAWGVVWSFYARLFPEGGSCPYSFLCPSFCPGRGEPGYSRMKLDVESHPSASSPASPPWGRMAMGFVENIVSATIIGGDENPRACGCPPKSRLPSRPISVQRSLRNSPSWPNEGRMPCMRTPPPPHPRERLVVPSESCAGSHPGKSSNLTD